MIPHGTPVATMLRLLARLRELERAAARMRGVAERERDRDLERGARREPGAKRDRRGDRRVDARRLRGRARRASDDPGGVTSPGRFDGRPASCCRRRRRRPRRRDRASGGRPPSSRGWRADDAVEVDRQREHEPLVVVGVVADQVHAPRRAVRPLRHHGGFRRVRARQAPPPDHMDSMTHRIAVIPGDGAGPEVHRGGPQGRRCARTRAARVEQLPWGSAYFHETGAMMPADALEVAPRATTPCSSAPSATRRVPGSRHALGPAPAAPPGARPLGEPPSGAPPRRCPVAARRLRPRSTCSSCARTPRASTRGVGGRAHQRPAARGRDRDGRLHARGRRAASSSTRSSSREQPRGRRHERDEVERLALRLRALGRGRRGGRRRASRTSRSSACSSTRSRRGWSGTRSASTSSSRRTSSATCSPTSRRSCRAGWAWRRARASRPGSATPGDLRAGHGSAPDIAGKGIANPLGAIWSASLMLEHLGEADGGGAADDARSRIRLPRRDPDARPRRRRPRRREVGDAVAARV